MSYTIPTDLSALSTQQKDFLKANYYNYLGKDKLIIYSNKDGYANYQYLMLGTWANQYNFSGIKVLRDGTVSSYTDSSSFNIPEYYCYSYFNASGTKVVDINNTSGGEIHFPPSNNISLEDNPLIKELQDDVSLIANFELAGYQITTQVEPSGYGTTSGDGLYVEGASVTLTATPNTHKTFVNWTLNDVIVSTDATYTFTMGSVAQTYVAHFTNSQQFDVIAKSSPSDLIMVYQSETRVYSGDTVTFRARAIDGYRFDHWSNGATTNPTTLTITSNTTMIAYYVKVADVKENYLYRAYIKAKTSINSLPIAFLNVKSFTIREDLLASANSEIECYSMPSEVSNGDLLCLYNPKGKVIYKGIITKINNKKITCSQMQSFYKGLWYENNYSTATTIESEYQYLLNQFANGYMYGSSYQDELVYDELAPLRVITGTSTSGNLETFEAKKTIDMEKYIYSLYQNYGILLEFNVPYGEWDIGDVDGGSTTIKVAPNTSIKIGDNAECIKDMSPTLEIENTNRLIVYSSNGVYRKTYVATSTSGIVEEPTSQVGRFSVVNTKVVFSDDELTDIVSANLPSTMYNHKVSFKLLLNNNIYDFWSWKLGQHLQVWNGQDYYSSVYTAYKMTKKENQEVSEVEITCGKVRTTLTDKLKLGVVND